MVNFWIQLPLKETLVATFNMACTYASKKLIAEQGMNVPVYQKHLYCFGRTAPTLL